MFKKAAELSIIFTTSRLREGRQSVLEGMLSSSMQNKAT
jgi:hypothetical protein